MRARRRPMFAVKIRKVYEDSILRSERRKNRLLQVLEEVEARYDKITVERRQLRFEIQEEMVRLGALNAALAHVDSVKEKFPFKF